MQIRPFADVADTPEGHFKLYFYAAILKVIDQLVEVFETQEAAFERFPFLIGYVNELAQVGLEGLTISQAVAWWREQLSAWEAISEVFLPIRALQEAGGFSYDAIVMYICLGFYEEDARFGALIEMLQNTPGQPYMTSALLNAWWADSEESVRAVVHQFKTSHLVHVVNPDSARVDWILRPTPVIWDVIAGRQPDALKDWVTYRSPADLMAMENLVISDAMRGQLEHLSELLTAREIDTLLVRGPLHNGRKTLLGTIARTMNCGMLDIRRMSKLDDDRWGPTGPLATVLHALPVITLDISQGETAELPPLDLYDGPVCIVTGRQGGVRSRGRLLTLNVEMPSLSERRVHWQHALCEQAADSIDEICQQFRLTRGGIYQTANLARTYMQLANRSAITVEDVQRATRVLNRQALDSLTSAVPTSGDWSRLAVSNETLQELKMLESRCRHREQLHGSVSSSLRSQITTGVRALFTGPSGTGKTLAAGILASTLKMDLYRLDLSSVVNKYIGETEKNLNELFSRAEELDVILLIDEGDALLTQRTNVHTSNDRYANLETNFLLQRLESYTGVVIITTNAGDRIDSAFQRRMDVVIEFRAPEIAERWAIWNLHLPRQHRVEDTMLREVTTRCNLTGGQIRNIVLHATVLALDDGGLITSSQLETAIQREYRKIGAVYPLRAQNAQPER